MKRLYDFRCDDCDHVAEKLTHPCTHHVECPVCGGRMMRQIATPTIKLEGITGAFPTAHDHWANVREQRARIHAKRNS